MRLLIESEIEGNDFEEISKYLSEDYYQIVQPRHADGQTIIQIIVEITKVTIPALATYLVTRKGQNKLTLKYKGKVELELSAAVNKKEISKQKLIEYFSAIIDKLEKKGEQQDGDMNGPDD